jgi:hypothetical protein
VDWIGLAKDRNRWRAVVNSALNLRVPWNAGKLSSGLTSSGLSSRAQLHRVSYQQGMAKINDPWSRGRYSGCCEWHSEYQHTMDISANECRSFDCLERVVRTAVCTPPICSMYRPCHYVITLWE